jgi:hypothetical protein
MGNIPVELDTHLFLMLGRVDIGRTGIGRGVALDTPMFWQDKPDTWFAAEPVGNDKLLVRD